MLMEGLNTLIALLAVLYMLTLYSEADQAHVF